jgi:flagellar protein FlgJ
MDIDLSSKVVNQFPFDQGLVGPGEKAGNLSEEGADLHALKKACKDFESIFLYTLLKTMRQSLPKPEEAGTSGDIYTSMGDLEVARSLAQGRGMGLGDLLFKQLKEKVR